MGFLFIYLVALFIAPQLWLEPFVGVPCDYLIYPLWLLYAVYSTKAELLRFVVTDVLFVVFLVWMFISAAVKGFHPQAYVIFVDHYLKWLVLYFLVGITVRSIDDLLTVEILMAILVWVLVIEGIQHKNSPDGLGWAGQTLGWIDPSALAAGEKGRTKWVGIFEGMGVFCVAYTCVLPYFLQWLNRDFGKATRLVSVVALPPLLLAIYYTGSRGGLLASLGILALHFATKLKFSVRSIVITATLFSVTFMLAPSHLTSVRDSSNSAQHRIDMWGEGLDMLKENPLFGVGRGNFVQHSHSLIAHNSAIEIMAETGFVGLFLWVSTIYSALKGAYVATTSDLQPRESAVIMGLVISVAGYLISCMFVTLEYETLYFLLGLCVAIQRHIYKKWYFTSTDLRLVCILTLSFVGLIQATVILYN